MQASRSINCVGLFCPMPIVKTKLEMENMRSGETLEILADDPGFERDLPIWCEITGEKFLEIKKEGNIYKGYVLKK
jgi:tRNA 2-thiouridine synthesizing protein A